MPRVITFGTFDLLHYGHVRLLERCRERAGADGTLIVGVSSDAFTMEKKGRLPVYDEDQREHILRALACVDTTFLEKSFALKRRYIEQHRADVLIMGTDWSGKFDDLSDVCTVEYLERTPSISTTETIEKIKC